MKISCVRNVYMTALAKMCTTIIVNALAHSVIHGTIALFFKRPYHQYYTLYYVNMEHQTNGPKNKTLFVWRK